jgi:hypothetical protein
LKLRGQPGVNAQNGAATTPHAGPPAGDAMTTALNATATTETDDEARRRPVWKPLAAAGLGAAVLLATGYGVFASLQATAANTTAEAVNTGTLLLNLSNNGVGFSQAVSNLAPADVVNRYVTLTNSGSLAAKDLGVKVTATGDAVLVAGTTANPAGGLRVSIDSCTVAWTPTTGACSGTTSSVLTQSALSTLTGSTPTTLTAPERAAGATSNLKISLVLPDQTETSANGVLPTDTIQNKTTQLTWTFNQTQRTATTTSS